MIVCHCYAVSDRAIEAAALAGARTVADVVGACAAGGDCGSCLQAVESLVERVNGLRTALPASA